MDDILKLTDLKLLSICALLPQFDRVVLQRFAGGDQDIIEQLLTSDLVSLDATMNGMYVLREQERKVALAQLRAEHPQNELMLRTQIFEYFLGQMSQADSVDQRLRSEDDCFYQLAELFLLLAARQEWHTITRNTTSVRVSHPQQARNLRYLAFYESYVFIRTAQYDQGEAVLTTLLNQSELEPGLHLQILNALGHIHYYQNRYDRALAFYQQVYDLAGSMEDRFYQGIGLANIGQVYNEISAYDRAIDTLLQSLDIFRELEDNNREAQALYDIGNYAIKLGRWEFAQRYLYTAASLYEKLNTPVGLAYAYWGQGFLQHMLGDDSASEIAYKRALTILDSPESRQPSLSLDIYSQLGFLYQTQDRFVEAIAAYKFAIDFATQIGNHNWKNLIDYRLGNVFQRQGHLADAFAAYVQAIDGIEALGGATESEEIKIGLLGATQQLYEAIVLLCLELGQPADAFHYVERARSRAFLDTLVKRSPELYDAVAQPIVTLADVQAQLPEGALLIEYFTTGVLPSGEHMLNSIPASNTRLREHLTLPPQVILFAITRDRCEIHRPALNPNSLRPPVGDRYPGRHLLHGRLPQHLYDRLIAPAAELLVGCDMLYLVPHGPLHYVPFTALRSAAGAYLLHAAGPALAHAPSATILLRNCIGRPPAHGGAALAIGFNDPQGDQPLRYAEAEAQHVARILGGDAWIGREPKSERLIAAGRGIRWLHIAGHARFNPTDPLGSELYLGPGDPLSARAIIRDLDLAADLVTLSSCTSGVSHVVPGDELLGLQRALLYAGAPTVLCTRWEARDLVSLLVMDLFYTALQQGRPAGMALRDAQIAVRELTGPELTTLIERWNVPDDLTLNAQSVTRALADMDLGTIRDMWRGEAPDLVAALDQPAVQPRTQESRPFADPLFWAPFMLVGRA